MSKSEITEKDITFFKENGYLVVENIIDSETIASYQKTYDDFYFRNYQCRRKSQGSEGKGSEFRKRTDIPNHGSFQTLSFFARFSLL